VTRPLFIAEVKPQSPWGFESAFDKWQLLEMAVDHGDLVALHTEEPWGGSLGWLRSAGAWAHERDKLVLAKGMHQSDDSVKQALHFGADLVLVVGRKPPPALAPVCIWEPRTFGDLVADGAPGQATMWNQRDLETGEARERSDFAMARASHTGWLCQASFISEPADINLEADAFIVGQELPSFIQRALP
jgi:indole-3-glycerol phosphate synthase